MKETNIRDVAIIGAGPVGLFAVFECGMLGLSCHVIDSLPEIGGQCTALYPEKPIYDIPAWPSITGEDLIAKLEEQAAPFEPLYHLNAQIVSLSNEGGLWRLCSTDGHEFYARTIIIAGGTGSFGPNRPPLDGIEAYEGTSVFYMVRRKEAFAAKHIIIAGGGDSAVDWALALSDMAASLSVVHRRDKFRAAPDNVEKLRRLADEGKISLVVPAQLSGLEGDGGQLTGVRVSQDGQKRTLQADILLPFFGLAADLGPIADWGLHINRQTVAIDPSTAETNIHGIYAIGDIAEYKDKLKLILTGFAEAAHAAHAIYKRLNPDTPLRHIHSTDKGLPGK